MSSSDFLSLKSFLKTFIMQQDIKRSQRTRIALVSYSFTSRLDYDLSSYTTAQSQYTTLFNTIDALTLHPGSGNNFGSALQQCVSAFSSVPSNRALYPNVIVFTADGSSDNPSDTQTQANVAKSSGGAFIVTLGIGSSFNQQELQQMASVLSTATTLTPAYYSATSYAGIFDSTLVTSLVRASCIPPPTQRSTMKLIIKILFMVQ